MSRCRPIKTVLASLWLLALHGSTAFGQLEDEFEDSVGYASAETELTLPEEIGQQDDHFTHVIEPGAMANAIDSPPWHTDDQISPMAFSCPSDGYCDTPCPACRQARHTGWSAALDVLVFTPTTYHNDNRDWSSPTIGSRLTLKNELLDGSGFEFRLAGTQFNDEVRNHTSSSFDPLYDHLSIETLQIDLDFYQRVWINNTNVVFSIGPRLASLNRSYAAAPGSGLIVNQYQDNSTVAGGVGFGVALNHSLYRSDKSELSLIGYARQSWLTGDFTVPTGSAYDTSLSIREVAWGLEWRHQMRHGDMTAKAVWETQQWWGAGDSLNLSGVSFGVGYEW